VGFVLAATLAAQTVTEIRLRVEPESRRIRPGETAVIQQRTYGRVTNKQGEEKSGRLQRAIGRVTASGGWLSKPFLFPGKETESFVQADNGWSSILTRGVGQFTVKDSVLFTAPEQEGRYRIDVDAEGRRESVEIEVTRSAPAQRVPEQWTFQAEPRAADPYRKLVEHYAPFVAQETWWQPKADMLARFDFDNDWDGANNWDNLEQGSSQAYVYYAVMETATHWFLHYNFFHPRDYSDNCVAGTCHENDNEGLILAVRKSGSEFGEPEVMETLAHNNLYSFTNSRGVRRGVHNIDGALAMHDGSHPMVFVEAGGHGVLGVTSKSSLFDPQRMEFQNTGITYVYKGKAERARHGNDRNVGYELLPIYEHWWTRARGESAAFDAFYTYEPLGGRPRLASGARIGGAFLGRKFGANKAKPFWGWHDEKTRRAKVLATGQWGLDPAYAFTRNLTVPQPWATDYTFNPYLEDRETPAAPAGAAANVIAGQPGFDSRAADTRRDPLPPPPAEIRRGEPPASRVETAHDGWGDPVKPVVNPPGPGSCEIAVTVDGVARVRVYRDQVEFESESGEPPAETTFRCTTALPGRSGFQYAIEKSEGRGNVRLEREPAESNGYEAVLKVEDPARGKARYRFTFRWNPAP
jgi:hypothetical protein